VHGTRGGRASGCGGATVHAQLYPRSSLRTVGFKKKNLSHRARRDGVRHIFRLRCASIRDSFGEGKDRSLMTCVNKLTNVEQRSAQQITAEDEMLAPLQCQSQQHRASCLNVVRSCT